MKSEITTKQSTVSYNEMPAPKIETGSLHAYFIYDIADTIDLLKLKDLGGGEFRQAQLQLRAVSSPSYIQFAVPPLAAELPPAEIMGLQVQPRIKLYDYGTVSIRLSFNYSGNWSGFAELARQLKQSEQLQAFSHQILKQTLAQAKPALNKEHDPLVEDYFVLEVESFQPPLTANNLLANYKEDIASLLLAETGPVTAIEAQDALKVIFSFLQSDLAVIHWDAAFVFDNREGAEAVESILEFANTQLVELRTYDSRLDAELDRIYRWNIAREKPHGIFGYRASEDRTDQLRNLLVDIRELCDRSNNALKIIGDAFYARLYRGIASRLGLNDWQQQIESKLASIGEIYRFATDKTQHARSQFLEIIIIILIVVEIIIGVLRVGR
jgi:hypothetical protein